MNEQVSVAGGYNVGEKKEKSSKFSFRLLEVLAQEIKNEDQTVVQELIKELKEDCLSYLSIAEEYKKAQSRLQDSISVSEEDRRNLLDEFERKSLDKEIKQSAIVDDLNVLHRLFETASLDVSWHCAFVDDRQFQEWVNERCRELKN